MPRAACEKRCEIAILSPQAFLEKAADASLRFSHRRTICRDSPESLTSKSVQPTIASLFYPFDCQCKALFRGQLALYWAESVSSAQQIGQGMTVEIISGSGTVCPLDSKGLDSAILETMKQEGGT